MDQLRSQGTSFHYVQSDLIEQLSWAEFVNRVKSSTDCIVIERRWSDVFAEQFFGWNCLEVVGKQV